jgi:hypothetical protein
MSSDYPSFFETCQPRDNVLDGPYRNAGSARLISVSGRSTLESVLTSAFRCFTSLGMNSDWSTLALIIISRRYVPESYQIEACPNLPELVLEQWKISIRTFSLAVTENEF